ncbi:unnamed protein product [Adineta ricciae]|uniref:G-protein coupled receptors family 1 profile domain-containing protein n=1 Tax=Adineta ricciae TaxID=249248 RepID=A0A814NKC9_ADIRI|nr:unnamed protein product [Adineta ricciae]CAF1093104.1 unnamed protein product [Adineta ricciae]
MPLTVNEIFSISQKYSSISAIIIFILAIIGNAINILVFTSFRAFRNNQCALYLIVEALANLFQLTIYFFIYLFVLTHSQDSGASSIIWCKLRASLIIISTLVAFSSICFCTIDQYLSTSHRYFFRQLSTIKLAYILLAIAFVFALLQSIPFAVFSDIQGSVCTVFNPSMTAYISSFYYPVLSGLLPVMITSMFSLLAYRNVRQIVRRQVPIVRRRLDQQLTAMVLVRVIALVILSVPYISQRMFVFITKVNPTNLVMYAIVSLVGSFTTSFFNLNCAISFYLFVAVSRRFRRQVKYVLSKKFCLQWRRWCCRGDNQVNPMRNARPMESSGDVE